MDKKKRAQIESSILTFAKKITTGGNNETVYKNLFAEMNEAQFDTFWEAIKRRGYIPIFLDNFDTKEMVDYDNCIKLSKEWNIKLEQSVTIPDPDTGISYTTPEDTVVGIVESTKQRQIISKKIGVSKNDYQVDDLTGQPTGESKAGGISNPEVNILVALGLTTTAKELVSVKGGDIGAYNYYKSQLTESGVSSTNEALRNGTGAKSLQTAQWLLRGRHIISDIGAR